MKIRILNIFVVAIASGFLITSCYPDKTEDVEDLDIVQTQYDPEFDFTTKSYYLLPDTVAVIPMNEDYDKSEEEIALDQEIINELEFQMNNAGYIRLNESDTTDNSKMNKALIVLPSRSTVSYTDYYYDYYYYGGNYWDFYYGLNYYYPGYRYNYYYPWGYPVSYSYSVGTVIIEMIDPTDPFSVDQNNDEVSYPVRWMATLNGLAELSYENTEKRMTDGIKQAFDQSGYLYQE